MRKIVMQLPNFVFVFDTFSQHQHLRFCTAILQQWSTVHNMFIFYKFSSKLHEMCISESHHLRLIALVHATTRKKLVSSCWWGRRRNS